MIAGMTGEEAAKKTTREMVANMTTERLEALRRSMKMSGIDAYLVPTADPHHSEYVGEHFACRKYLTGFTGSAGTALVTADWAGLWTDGRYFVQAGQELSGSGIELMRAGVSGVPTIEQFLQERMPECGCLGFDGRVVTAGFIEKLKQVLDKKQVRLCGGRDLVGEIWEDRPSMSARPLWVLEERYAGESAASKLGWLREVIQRSGATVHILTTLDDIAWLLNIRGNDIPCNMTPLAYAVVTAGAAMLYVQKEAVSSTVQEYLSGLGVEVCPYEDIFAYTDRLCGERVLLEKQAVNDSLYRKAANQNEIIDLENPTTARKAVKNRTELHNLRKAHVKDGIAMVHFLFWLKKQMAEQAANRMSGEMHRISEVAAAEYLDQLRREQGALDVSFETISAYGANAAMCHYHAEPENCACLKPKGLYLVDSGGQYYEGTTDITRTIALGAISQKEREHFTLVLMSMLRLGNAVFPANCCNLTLDYAARELLWQRGLDFDHGTGHGVGYLSNVHERPVAIRSRYTPGVTKGMLFCPGMVCSDEPGLYLEGKYGIRTENLMVCVEKSVGTSEAFFGFEFLTLAPIDLDAVDVSLMEQRDKDALNRYHRLVYEELSRYFEGEELAWLRHATRAVE